MPDSARTVRLLFAPHDDTSPRVDVPEDVQDHLQDDSRDDQQDDQQDLGWRIINDTVMGGVSESRFTTMPYGARFEGTVSLDQGGGFASVRAPESIRDVSEADAFRVRVRGDGQTYAVTAYTATGGRVSYRQTFTVPKNEPEDAQETSQETSQESRRDGWTRVVIPFADLTPYRRGRHVPSAPAFDPSTLRTFGFLIGEKQAGPFHLDIREIAAIRTG